ncbi:hypothetical protein DIPPA_11682 [Diplonema papillatum]|nr:hypothetical protein DIPPA_11682 [Diplonema papillatum]
MRSARRTGSDPPAHDRQDSRVIHRFEAKVACSTAHRGAVWTAEDDAVHVRDAATGCARSPAPVYQKPGVTVHALLRLTTGGVWCGLDDGYIVIVDCETYQEISSFRQHNGAVLAFGQSAVGEKLVYSGGADWKVYEWTSERDEEGRAGLLRMFHSHSNSIRAIEVTDGGFLVSASSDNTVRVWDLGADDTADQSECFARLDSHDGAVKALAIQQWRDPPPPTADFSSRAQALGLTSGDPVPAGAQLETPSKCLIWSADETGTLCLWGLDAIVERRAASPVGRAVGAVPLLALRDAHSGAVARLAAFGERQVWSCGQDGKVLCWAVEWEGGEAEPVVTLVRNLASPGRLTSMQLCGRYVIQKLWVCSAAARGGGGAEGTVTAWNVEVPAHEAPDGQATHTQLDDVLLRWNEQRPAAADPTITTNYPPGGCSREEADRLRAEVQQLRRELSEAGGRQQQQQQQQKESSSRESDRTRDEKKLQAAESAVAELRRELAEARRAPGRAGGGPSAVDQDILRRLEELRKENEWLQKNAKELVAAKTKTCELLRLDVARLANELGMRDEDDKRRESASLSRSARRSASGGVDLEDLERQNQDLARTVLNLRDGLRDTSDELRDTADELQQTKRALHDAKRGGNHPSPMSRSSSGGLVGQQQQRSASVLESQLQDLMLAVEDKTDEVQHLRSVIRKQQNDAAHRMSPGSHRDTGSIRDALDDSQDAVAKQHRTIAQLEDRINNLHGLLDDERRANGELQEEVNNQAVAVENVTADNKSLVALLGNAREDAENQRTVVGSLKDILVERNKSIDLLREVVQERTQQIEALEEDLRSAQLRHEMSDGDRRSGFELTDKRICCGSNRRRISRPQFGGREPTRTEVLDADAKGNRVVVKSVALRVRCQLPADKCAEWATWTLHAVGRMEMAED